MVAASQGGQREQADHESTHARPLQQAAGLSETLRISRTTDGDQGSGRTRRGRSSTIAAYSCRSASIGSSRAARRAGQAPKNTPTPAADTTASPSARSGISSCHSL